MSGSGNNWGQDSWWNDDNDDDDQENEEDDGQDDGQQDGSSHPSWWNSSWHHQYKEWGQQDVKDKKKSYNKDDGKEEGGDGKKGRSQPYNFAKYRRRIRRETERELKFWFKKEKDQLEQTHVAEILEMEEERRKQQDDHEKEMNRLREEHEDRVRQLEARLGSLEQDVEAKQREIVALRREIARMTMLAASANTQISNLESEISQGNLTQQQTEAKLADARRQKRVYDNAIQKWQNRVANLKNEVSILKARAQCCMVVCRVCTSGVLDLGRDDVRFAV